MNKTFEDFVELNPQVSLPKCEDVPYVPMAAITPGQRRALPTEIRASKGSGSKFSTGDTLFARITPCLENGKIAQYFGVSKSKGSTEIFVLRAREGVAFCDFVYYFALQKDFRNVAVKSMSGASGRQRADIQALKDYPCSFPDLPTQRKIAGILSAYDDLIENNLRRIKILEEMAQSLYREWFVHFRFPGHESVKMVDSSLGSIPEGWEVNKLGDIAEDVRRGVPKGGSSSLCVERWA